MAKKPQQAVDAVPDPDRMNPQSDDELLERGWLYYSQQKFELADADFNAVIQKEPSSVDAWYALALNLRLMGKAQKAVDAFSRIDSLVGEIEDHQRAMIISRLAHGQINLIKTGNWNLEKEVWKK